MSKRQQYKTRNFYGLANALPKQIGQIHEYLNDFTALVLLIFKLHFTYSISYIFC